MRLKTRSGSGTCQQYSLGYFMMGRLSARFAPAPTSCAWYSARKRARGVFTIALPAPRSARQELWPNSSEAQQQSRFRNIGFRRRRRFHRAMLVQFRTIPELRRWSRDSRMQYRWLVQVGFFPNQLGNFQKQQTNHCEMTFFLRFWSVSPLGATGTAISSFGNSVAACL